MTPWPRLTDAELPAISDFTTFHPFIKGVFSQWHPSVFTVDGERFATAEQWMMVCKARLFGDQEQAVAILATAQPSEQKRYGGSVARFEQSVWDEAKLGIVYRGNLEKFSQNRGALRQLCATAPAMLVEANPRDWIWGVGRSIDDPAITDPAHWRGTNLLGRILTRVRQDLVRP